MFEHGIPYRIHVFTNTTETCMLKVTGMGVIDYLVVGGGGAGGSGLVVIRYVYYPGTVILLR